MDYLNSCLIGAALGCGFNPSMHELMKTLSQRIEVWRFYRALIEPSCYRVELGVGIIREINSFGKILSQEWICPVLPDTVSHLI